MGTLGTIFFRWENLKTGEYLIGDSLGKIRTYGIN